jgi:hypothetical protein
LPIPPGLATEPFPCEWNRSAEGKQFFFEKKNQKTFALVAYASGDIRDSEIKVFCVFSSEKKALLHRVTVKRIWSHGEATRVRV